MATAEVIAPPAEIAERRTFRHRWYRTPTFVAGLLILGTLAVLVAFAPLITSWDPVEQDLLNILQPPSSEHLLGTDHLGRDIWSRLLYGGRIDLQVGFIAVLISFVIGTVLGAIAGYRGGWLDTVIMRIVDVFVAFPFFVLVIALVFVLGAGTRSMYIAIAFVGWVSYARIVRGEILVAKEQEYVLAARAAGFSDRRIVGRHIFPNVITQSIVYAMSDIVISILAIVTLGYVGIGVPPPTPDWGSMIFEGQTFLTTNWQLSTFPGIAVVITGLGLSLVGDGLADLLKPE